MTRATRSPSTRAAGLNGAQLKRFEYVPFGRGKLNQFVEYPLVLDVSAAMSDADANAKGEVTYELFGVLVHSGSSMHSGHYYCYVKGATGHWYEMDDESVTPCGGKDGAETTRVPPLLRQAEDGAGRARARGEKRSRRPCTRCGGRTWRRRTTTRRTPRRKRRERRGGGVRVVFEAAAKNQGGDARGGGAREGESVEGRASDDHARAVFPTKPPPLALERSESRRRREKPSAAAGDENVRLPGVADGVGGLALGDAFAAGKLLSSRDSARLRLAEISCTSRSRGPS